MEIIISAYGDWMKPQVAEMFSHQYGVSKREFSSLIENFYEHPFQKDKCIRIAAVEDKKVVGFQSFFYWPYEMNGRKFRSFQSGNSLVHPHYRNRGIFRKLLEYVDVHREEMGIDFLIGFPIDVSKNSLLGNGWKNILDLDWYVCPSSIFSFVSRHENEKLKTVFKRESGYAIGPVNDGRIHISNENGFVEWRENYSPKGNYFYHTYSEGDKSVRFSLKTSRRKKIIRELTIGNILTGNNDPAFIQKGLKDLIRKVRSSRCISMVSFAQNSASGFLTDELLRNAGLKKINKRIYFCVKSFAGSDAIEDASKWLLFRSDIDTW